METPSLDYIRKLSKGNTDFETKILQVIKDEFPVEKELYYQKLLAGDYNEIAKIVHKLKHKMAVLSLEKGHKLAIEYEASLKLNQIAFQDEFESVLHKITLFLKQIV